MPSLYKLINAPGNSVTISDYGAIITSFIIHHKDGSPQDIVLGFDTVQEYQSPSYLASCPYFGAAIGRYANRIANAGFPLNGKTVSLSRNNERTQLHGGFAGFDKKLWQVESLSDKSLLLHYRSEDGEEGFPGTLDVHLQFEFTDNNELRYSYTATTDQLTAVNLTHHSYFNLSKDNALIGEHFVKLNAAAYLEQDDAFVATGRVIPVANSSHDFTHIRKINENWNAADGYDQSFVLNPATGDALNFAAEAVCGNSHLKLEVFTDDPIVHFYTGKWIPEMKGRNRLHYKAFSGLCFETQRYPNAVNIPAFPSTLLHPGETYKSATVYRVSGNLAK